MFLKRLIPAVALTLGLGLAGAASAADITGAGATFPYPVYAKWAEAYKQQTGTGLNYQSIGSGGGIKQIKSKTVDFGASDMPLPPADLEKDGLTQFPTVMGGVVPVYNLPGIEPGAIKLTGALLADIYLGSVAKWNDPAIAKLNPGVKLPDQPITVVHRSDGSGTTFIFTNYLSKVSAKWKSEIGEGTAVKWKTGIGGKGNEGVAGYVKNTTGAIGYVEYAYAVQNKLSYTQLQNKAGKFVKPESTAFQAAAANADWSSAPGFALLLTEQPGDASWPITGATFILMHKKPADPTRAADVLKFFDWAYAKGDKLAEDLHYVPMPDAVVKLIEASWTKEISGGNGAVWKK
ncbi:MAG: phosphate ABC transporter substrate-binding protein PstS [Alphaproteobacteria bacterium]|nr:phosphate ABC transporter substrate-binding protein PstS [Alphaproteobacteria bacterium]